MEKDKQVLKMSSLKSAFIRLRELTWKVETKVILNLYSIVNYGDFKHLVYLDRIDELSGYGTRSRVMFVRKDEDCDIEIELTVYKDKIILFNITENMGTIFDNDCMVDDVMRVLYRLLKMSD